MCIRCLAFYFEALETRPHASCPVPSPETIHKLTPEALRQCFGPFTSGFLPIIDLRDEHTFHDRVFQALRFGFGSGLPVSDSKALEMDTNEIAMKSLQGSDSFAAALRRLRKQMIAGEMCARKTCRLEVLGVKELYERGDTPAEVRDAISSIVWNPCLFLESEDVVRDFLERE